jgi:hypothetical protein
MSEPDRFDALEGIVRELAERGPFIDEDTGCVMCTQEWYLIRDNPSRWAMIDEHEPLDAPAARNWASWKPAAFGSESGCPSRPALTVVLRSSALPISVTIEHGYHEASRHAILTENRHRRY